MQLDLLSGNEFVSGRASRGLTRSQSDNAIEITLRWEYNAHE
ncbi:hypothetical protein BSU04_05030 [Caballeronia sordidicola]|uniref:Uncharacterized protein n=1 Tax=Caballeronia sordidicola TaxID=196367 RepID=A0A226X8F8_CABSO|nr:hypothetical protein BSU04_05030 [Caballeronia sordidicola]